MRLTTNEINTIKETIFNVFGKSEIRIFGSRLIDKKGGDIDIFVIPENRENLFRKKIKASAKLENILFKPVDILVHYDFDREIEKEALKGEEI